MICSQCGHQVDDNMNFCTNCGNPMNAPAPVAEPAAPVAEPATEVENVVEAVAAEMPAEPVVAEPAAPIEAVEPAEATPAPVYEAPVAPAAEPAPVAQPQYQPPQPQYQPAPQPTYQQPTYQQPMYQQPTYPQPQYQQPQPTYQYQQPTYAQPQYQYAQPAEEPSAGAGKPLGIVGMVLGILALFCMFMSFIFMTDTPSSYYGLDNWLESWVTGLTMSFIFSVTGLVLSIVGKSIASKRGCGNGPAKAGIICSAIALGFCVLFLIAGASIYAELYDDLYRYYW